MTFEISGETFGLWGAVLIAGIFFIAGLVKGLAAFGTPLVTMPLLAFIMPVPAAAALTVIPIFISNVVQAVQTRAGAGVARRLWPLFLLLPLVMGLSTRLITVIDPHWLFKLVGSMIVLFVILHAARKMPSLPMRLSLPLSALSGVIAGLLGGATSFYAFPSLQLFIALGLAPMEFVFATSTMFVTGAIGQGVGYAKLGLLQADELLVSLAVVVPLLAGQQIGQAIARRGSVTLFKRAVLAVMTVMGLTMIQRGFSL